MNIDWLFERAKTDTNDGNDSAWSVGKVRP